MAVGHKLEDFIGIKFNRITVVAESDQRGGARQWQYICECGKRGYATPSHIVKGGVKSCGCLHIEKSKENIQKALLSPLIGKNIKHGMYGTRPYRIWVGMKTRCDNEKVVEYKDYGGRGISYESKWETFEGFWEDMAEGYSDNLTLDRTDNNANYSRDNCSWKTMKEQSHNRRKNNSAATSIYVGVSKNKNKNCFRAAIVDRDGKRLYKSSQDEYFLAKWYDDLSELFYNTRPNNT